MALVDRRWHYAQRMPLLILWDVDHTLIENAGVSKDIYASAFRALTGHQPRCPAPTEGRTDPHIMRDFFALHGLTPPPWPVIESALQSAGPPEIEALRCRGWVLPGTREALESIRHLPHMVQSLLTGNIRTNARVKLAAFCLDSLVDMEVGAYGADGMTRGELVQVARDRASRKYNLPRDVATVLIGDTPRDVEAAREGAAHVVAIATGIHCVQELRDAGADVVLPDLRNTAHLVQVLLTLE